MRSEEYEWLGNPVYVPSTKWLEIERKVLFGIVVVIISITIIVGFRAFRMMFQCMLEDPFFRNIMLFSFFPLIILGSLAVFFSLKHNLEEQNPFGIYECGFCPPEKRPNLIRRTPRLCIRYSDIESVRTWVIYKKLDLKAYEITLKDGRKIYFRMNRINNMSEGHPEVLKISTKLLDYALENRKKGCIKRGNSKEL